MTIAVIVAMEEEIAPLKTLLGSCQTREIAGFEFHKGHFHSLDVVLLKSGIGKVNAAISTTLLLEHFHPERVINTGSAGGFDLSLTIGDLVVGEKVLHHDVDISAFGYEKGQVPKLPTFFDSDKRLLAMACDQLDELDDIAYRKGLIVSGDRFIHEEPDVNNIRYCFSDVLACDMEAAAIAQTCYIFNTPFVVIRAISDIPGKENVIAFKTFLEQATKTYTRFLTQMLKRL